MCLFSFVFQRQGWCFSRSEYDLGFFYAPLWIIWAVNIYFYIRFGFIIAFVYFFELHFSTLSFCFHVFLLISSDYFNVSALFLSTRLYLRRVFTSISFQGVSPQVIEQAERIYSKFLWIPFILVALRLGGSIDRVLMLTRGDSPWLLTMIQALGDPGM